jgi:hypothetical protein
MEKTGAQAPRSVQEASAMTVKDMIKNEIALLAKASQQLSQAPFDKIWINEEDAVYDTLCIKAQSEVKEL